MLLIIKENVIIWYECTVEAESQEGTMNPFIIIKQICPKKIEKLYTFNWPYMTNNIKKKTFNRHVLLNNYITIKIFTLLMYYKLVI